MMIREATRLRHFAWASYGMYGLSGFSVVLLGAVMPEFLHHYHASYALGGRVVFMQGIGFLMGVPLAAGAMLRFRVQRVLSLGALAVMVAQIVLYLLPPLWLASAVVLLNGVGAATLETVVASVFMDLLVASRAIYMSRLETSFGLGAMLMPSITGGFIALGYWRGAFLIIAVLGLALAIFWQMISIPSREAASAGSAHHDATMTAPPAFPHRIAKGVVLALFLSMTFVYVGLEGSINSFMPSLFISGLGVSASVAVFSSTLFWAGMVIGRLAMHWAARHLRYDHYLWLSITLVLVILLIFTRVRTESPGFGLIFLLGLAMAAIYSMNMVFANHTFFGRTRLITSLVTATAGVGSAVFPALLGYAMDHLAIGGVLWLLFAMGALLFLGLTAITWGFRYLVRMAREVPES